MDVDHDGTLLLVQLGRVDVEVEAVLISHGFSGRDVVLWADVAIIGGVKFLGEVLNLNWRLEKINKNFQVSAKQSKKIIKGSVGDNMVT